MDKFTANYVDRFMSELIARNPGEKEFHQAVREVVESVASYVTAYPHFIDLKILERMTEPEPSSSSVSRGWTTGARSTSTAVSVCR